MFELKKYKGVMFDDTEDWWKICRKTACKIDMGNLANFHKLRNGDFISESKMLQLNQNKKSKQLDRKNTVWQLYFTLIINE